MASLIGTSKTNRKTKTIINRARYDKYINYRKNNGHLPHKEIYEDRFFYEDRITPWNRCINFENRERRYTQGGLIKTRGKIKVTITLGTLAPESMDRSAELLFDILNVSFIFTIEGLRLRFYGIVYE